MSRTNLSISAGYAVPRRREALRLSERGKLIVGTALVLLELVAVAGLFGWLDRQDDELSHAGINFEELAGEVRR